MATIDETNIFAPQDPDTGQTYQLFDADAIKQKQVQSKEQYNLIKEQIKAGNLDQAYEGFTQLPFSDQMLLYINPVTGVPLESYEVVKFGAEAQPRLKTFEEFGFDMLDPRKKLFGSVLPSPVTVDDKGSALMSGLAGLGVLGGVFDLANIPKAILSPFVRKAPLYSKQEGTGGGGGTSDIQPQPKRDFAGFVSSVEKVALGPQKFGSGKDLINYIESPKRSGISAKELEYIDFDQIRNNPNLTKEDVVKYIQDNRPQIYRVQRSEDNPTYRADENQNPLNELPLNEEATRIANAEEQAYFRDEYAQEIADHNAILYSNPTLQNSNFVLNSENINDPSVLEDVTKYLFKSEPEAYMNIYPSLVKVNYPDGRQPALFNNNDLVTNPEVGGYTINDLQEVVKDGATIEFPALTRNADDIIEEASTSRVSPDFGNEIEVYESVGENTGLTYKIIGSENGGYQVLIDDTPATGDLGTGGRYDIRVFDDVADARARVQAESFDNGDILEGANTFDTGSNSDQLLETAPYDVITGEATLPTRFGYQYGDYRLPMGGAENYREFTLHIANPKTATRYDSTKGTKHFGGGDELLHYRVTDRIDEDGKKVLFVEEIQSDLHSTASSTRERANYEIGVDTKKQAVKELRDIFKNNNNLRVSDNGDIIKLDADSNYDTSGLLSAEEVANINYFERLTDLSSNINARKIGYLSDEEVKSLNKFREKYAKDNKILPDLPYKKNDYLELAVKDIMKLASEGDYERVAFTNPATQLMRNNKSLEYIDEIEVSQVPVLTEAEQQFNEKWMRNRDRSMISQMEPNRKLRLDGVLPNSELENFVNTHTDFVVNDSQANKLWQDFHKSENLKRSKNIEDYEEAHYKNSVESIFARYDSPPTPSKLAEDLYQSGIITAKKLKLQQIKRANVDLIKASVDRPQGALTKDEAYQFQKETSNILSSTDENIPLPNKPFDEITFDDLTLGNKRLDMINQDVRRGISKIMRNFYDHTLPNVEDAGKYIVKQKGTGYEIDSSKFMVERGDITEGYRNRKFDNINEMIQELRLDENLQKQIRNDLQKGNIPASTIDSQIYKVEAEGGSGKKPLDMYAKIIPQQVDKFAKKYDKSVKPQLKRVLYSNEEGIDANQLYSDFKAEEKLKLEEAQTEGLYGRDFEEPYTHEAVSIDITPEMRKAILTEGVNVMYKGGIVRKSQSMDRPIAGNTRYV